MDDIARRRRVLALADDRAEELQVELARSADEFRRLLAALLAESHDEHPARPQLEAAMDMCHDGIARMKQAAGGVRHARGMIAREEDGYTRRDPDGV